MTITTEDLDVIDLVADATPKYRIVEEVHLVDENGQDLLDTSIGRGMADISIANYLDTMNPTMTKALTARIRELESAIRQHLNETVYGEDKDQILEDVL